MFVKDEMSNKAINLSQSRAITRSILTSNGLSGERLEEVLEDCIRTYGKHAPDYAKDIREEDFN